MSDSILIIAAIALLIFLFEITCLLFQKRQPRVRDKPDFSKRQK